MNRKVPMVVEMLRDWYFIDSVLLNDHAKYAISESKDYEEYISLKAALLSDLNEFYNHIGYYPDNNEVPEDHRHIQESARNLAIKSKAVSARMLENNQMMKHMKKVIKEQFNKRDGNVDINDISDNIINERFLKMCLDNILIGMPMLECSKKDKVDDFKSEILEQAYLTVRSDIIKISKKYNEAFNPVKEGIGAAAAFGLKAVFGFMVIGAAARAIEAFANRCTNRCGTLRLNTASKKGCMLKCKIQVQQKIIASLRQSAAQTNNVQARNKFARDVKRAQLRMTQYQRQLATLSATRAGSTEVDPSERSRLA